MFIRLILFLMAISFTSPVFAAKRKIKSITCMDLLEEMRHLRHLFEGGFSHPRNLSKINDTKVRVFVRLKDIYGIIQQEIKAAGVDPKDENASGAIYEEVPAREYASLIQILKKQKLKFEYRPLNFLVVEGPVAKLKYVFNDLSVRRIWLGDSPKELKDLGTEIRLAEAIGPIVKTGERVVDFRQGRREWSAGRAHFRLNESNEIIPITLERVTYKKMKELSSFELENQGVKTPEEALGFMRDYYPDLTLESEITVVEFRLR